MKLKILAEDQNSVKLLMETDEDVKIIASVISLNDRVSMKTLRKIKKDENVDSERKLVFMKINVQKKEYNNELKKLKLLGKIVECSDQNVQLNSYHSFEIESGSTIAIEKDRWDNIDRYTIQKALRTSKKKLLNLLLMDEQSCIFSELNNSGYSIKVEIKGNLSKKSSDYDEEKKKYYTKILNYLSNIKNLEPLVIAGPGFAKEDFAKLLIQKLKLKNVKVISASYVNESGLHELINSEELKDIVKDFLIADQQKIVNAFLVHVSKAKDDVVYGIAEVKLALDYHAINHLIVLESLLDNLEVRDIVNKVLDMNLNVTIISDDSEPGQLFSSFKIAAFTKFKVN
ncbi:MAG: mRNA surveillance protein pelota [Candidatus Micrarchaeota archaeon]|nr:mRNA surveillance protein pelota [Candidatus Micrarchaeota archaeon]